MKPLIGISQSFNKYTKATLPSKYFSRAPITASALKQDNDIITIKSTESLKLFWYEEVARRWIEINWKSFPSFSTHK